MQQEVYDYGTTEQDCYNAMGMLFHLLYALDIKKRDWPTVEDRINYVNKLVEIIE
jgi:hypothetical protein